MISNQKGFSLLEVMVSFALIGVGALGLVKLQSYVEQRADYAVRSIEALAFAEQQLEYLRTRYDGAVPAGSNLIPFDGIKLVDPTDGYMGPYCLTSMPGLSDAGYTLDCNFPYVSQMSGALKTVSVTVSWTDRLKQHQSITLNTMISKYSEFD